MENKKEFRKKVLQIHYDVSTGNTWNLVMRTIVAEKLGLKNYTDDDLLGTIKYLEDKGYLKASTNMEDQITDLGIDEVENSYPHLYPHLCPTNSLRTEEREEIVKLSPEFYGVGINLKAMWRKLRSYFKR